MIQTFWLGRIPIEEAITLQEKIVEKRVNAYLQSAHDPIDVLLIAEHPSVYTYDKHHPTYEDDIAHPTEFWKRVENEKIKIIARGSGGRLTYHGPGQLVVYSIIDIAKVAHGKIEDSVALTERVLARTLETYNIHTVPHCDMADCLKKHRSARGAWVEIENERRKLASCGFLIRMLRFSTFGFALNISTDLSYFDPIYPCGLRGIRMTSIEKVLGEKLDMIHVAKTIAEQTGILINKEVEFSLQKK